MNPIKQTRIIFIFYGLEKQCAVAVAQFNPGMFYAVMHVISICDISIC
jgi:hypothetical protein